jgi:hypothetical protein
VYRLYKQGRIKRNYAAEDRRTGQSYYGRGFVQLTWADNYKRMGRELGMGDKLYQEPDLVLDPDIATKILWIGMIKGNFRPPNRLKKFFNAERSDWTNARNIINGDTRKLGKRIGGYGRFYANSALKFRDAPTRAEPPRELAATEVIEHVPAEAVMMPKPRPRTAAPAGAEQPPNTLTASP